MKALNLSLFDTVALSAADVAAITQPRAAARSAAPVAESVPLWRQSCAAHDLTPFQCWTLRACYALLGVMSLVAIACAAVALGHSLFSHDGLQAGVASLMGR